MKRTRRQYFTGLISGLLLAVLISNLAAPVLALARQYIEVYSGVNIYVDDKKIDPKDANGKSVPVFAYNGTTYLPIRAISNALGKPIVYDGSTYSVYVGKHSGTKPAVLLRNMDYFTGNSSFGFSYYDGVKDNLGNIRNNVLVDDEGSYQTYLLNGQYSAISGTLFQSYIGRDNSNISYIEIYGDDVLLYRETITRGEFPKDFKVNITGVLMLKVKVDTYFWSEPYAGVADLGLWT